MTRNEFITEMQNLIPTTSAEMTAAWIEMADETTSFAREWVALERRFGA